MNKYKVISSNSHYHVVEADKIKTDINGTTYLSKDDGEIVALFVHAIGWVKVNVEDVPSVPIRV